MSIGHYELKIAVEWDDAQIAPEEWKRRPYDRAGALAGILTEVLEQPRDYATVLGNRVVKRLEVRWIDPLDMAEYEES